MQVIPENSRSTKQSAHDLFRQSGFSVLSVVGRLLDLMV
jgi:hypothetical protein